MSVEARDRSVVITETDRLDRNWTILALPAVVGFRYTIYLYGGEYHTGALELIFPGGVANGWTEMDMHEGTVQPLLRGIALAMGTELGS